MSNVKKQKKLKIITCGICLTVFGFILHNYLAGFLDIFPNAGISFGLYSNLLVVIAFLSLMVVLLISVRHESLSLMIVAAGGLINFVDRIIFGYVRDYWNLGFAYNNLADWIIFFGVLYSVVMLWKKK